MTRITALVAGLFCASALAISQGVNAASEFKGNWTMTTSDQAGMVRFALMQRMDGGNMQSESDWPTSVFSGLVIEGGKHDVQFNITRDAGRFDCEGYLKDGTGAGIFRFTANAKYPADMKALGFSGIDDEKQFVMAVHDVSVEFARQMKRENLIGLDAEKLIAFRVHKVTPDMVRAVRKAGIEVSEDQLIAFRVHGVSPEFIKNVEGFGFARLEPDQLIAMRVHGVTPEFIADLKSRGVKDLTIDQLINLRVHGIN